MDKKFDIEDVRRKTWFMNSALESYRKFFDDPSKESRIADQECLICYYGSRIAGQAMTRSNCAICDKEKMFGNTNVDRICFDCASKHGLCKHCGADIEYKDRKKL